MENTKINKPKPTLEIVKEYDELHLILNSIDKSFSDKDINAVSARMDELMDQYDWFNVEFTDPITGMKGLKTVADEIIAPPVYDGFNEYQSYVFSPHYPVVAIRDGKCGIIKADGSGHQLCNFKFDSIRTIQFCSLFLAKWNGVEDRFGIITVTGNIICPNTLTSLGVPANGIMNIYSGNKCGVIDIESYQCALPEYDDLYMDWHDPVVFFKGNQRGYVIEDTGEFVPVEQYGTDEKYIDAPIFQTRI